MLNTISGRSHRNIALHFTIEPTRQAWESKRDDRSCPDGGNDQKRLQQLLHSSLENHSPPSLPNHRDLNPIMTLYRDPLS